MQRTPPSKSHVSVSSAAVGSGGAGGAANNGRGSNVDDIVSRYVLSATLPSERSHRAPRSNTPPARSTGTPVLTTSGLVYSPASQRLSDRYAEIRRSENQLVDLRNKMEQAGRRAEEVAATVKELERSKVILAELESENMQLRTRVRTVSLLVEEKEQGIREMESSLRTARQQLAETEDLRVQDMTSLRKQIAILQQENSDLASRCDGLRASITSRDCDVNLSRDDLRVRLLQLETQLETSRNTNFRLSHQLEEKEHQLDDLRKLQQEIPRLEGETKETMQRLQDAQKMLQVKEDERLRIQEQHLRQLRDLSQQLDSWKREASRIGDRGFEQHQLQSESSSRVAQRDTEIVQEIGDKVRSILDELRRRQVEVERIQIDIQHLNDENRILREMTSTKEFAVNEATMLKAQIRQLEENISLLQQLNSDLKVQLEKREANAVTEAATHLNEVEKLKKELATVKSEAAALESIKKENSKLRKEVQKQPNSERVNELRAEKSVLEQAVTELREKLIGMTANAIQVERIYAEQLEDLHKEVAQLKIKEAECRANHLNPEREAELQSRTIEIEAENEILRQRMEANLKLQAELSGERKKEAMKREQQISLQSQLSTLTFGRADTAHKPSSPRGPAMQSNQPLSAADMYVQRLHRANTPSGTTAPQSIQVPPRVPSSAPTTEDLAPSMLRMTSALDAKGVPSASNPLPSTTSFSAGALTAGMSLSHIPYVSSSTFAPVNAQPSSLASGPSFAGMPLAVSASSANFHTASPRELEQTATFSSFSAGSKPAIVGNKVAPSTTIRYAEEGVGSIRFGTLSQLFLTAAEGGGATIAIKSQRHTGRNEEGPPGINNNAHMGALEWSELTWQQYYIKAAQFAKALISHRCEENATVMIISNGSAEASIAFCGSVLAACLPTTAYTTSPTPHLIRQIEETAAEIIVLDDAQLLQRLLNTTRRAHSIKQFVLCGSNIPPNIRSEFGQMVATFDQFVALCAYVTDTMLQTRLDGQSVDHPACICYTAGTTGEPKGVLLSHDNLQFAAASFAQAMVLTDSDSVSHLSLESIAEAHNLVVDIVLPMVTIASKGMPFVTHYVTYNGETSLLPLYFRAIRPTFFFAGQNIYQDLLLCIRAAEQESRTESDLKLQQWAKSISKEASFQRQRDILNRIPSGPIKGSHLAASMNDKIKAALGLDRVVQTICAGGPLSMPLLESFAGCGFDVLQLYSSTETSGLATASAEACFQFGTCGFPFPSTEMRIDASPKASDRQGYREGELLIRGRHVMIGYLITNANAKGPDSEGWLRTGDLGRMDSETGLLTVLGRVREQVVLYPTGSPLSPSDRISPLRIELEISRICPAVSHVVIFGDQRKFLVALMTLRSKRNPVSGTFTDELCGEALDVNPEVLTVTTARRDEKWLKYIAGVIAQCNSVAENPVFKVKRFCILPSDFSTMGGELTASGKVKRSSVLTKYSALVDKLYAEESSSTPRKS